MLVVDDNAPLRMVMERTFEREGMVVTTAGSRAEGMAQTGRFVVGIFDLDLGDGTGVEVARHLLATGQVSHCVFFSGDVASKALCEAKRIGPVFYKGDGLRHLSEHLRQLLGGQAGPQRQLA